MITKEKIDAWVTEHNVWRTECMNLIASENAFSADVKKHLSSDLVQRYGNYLGRDLTDRRYTGSKFVKEIELALDEIAKDVFGASEVELRAISGHVAGLAVIMAVCKPGDMVMEIDGGDGGHGLAIKAAKCPLVQLDIHTLPFDPVAFNVDAAATVRFIRENKPRLVILGSSNFLFPNPVKEIAQSLADSPETILGYDASHVMGLLACGEFQKPLEEGAHVVFGSTHKTLPGPQGGLIYSNDSELMDAIATAVYPGIVTNHHLMRSPSLALALLEMKHNPGYARQVIANARALGLALHQRGIPVVAVDRGVTNSHTVLIQVAEFGSGREIARRLEDANILTSYTRLPKALGVEGIRFGSNEATRMGAVEQDMEQAAEIIAQVIKGSLSPEAATGPVKDWAQQFRQIHFV